MGTSLSFSSVAYEQPETDKAKKNAAKSVLGNTNHQSDKIRNHPLEEQDQRATCTNKS